MISQLEQSTSTEPAVPDDAPAPVAGDQEAVIRGEVWSERDFARLVKDDLPPAARTLLDKAADAANDPAGTPVSFDEVAGAPRGDPQWFRARRDLGMFTGLVRKHGHTNWPVLVTNESGGVSYKLTPQVAGWWAKYKNNADQSPENSPKEELQ